MGAESTASPGPGISRWCNDGSGLHRRRPVSRRRALVEARHVRDPRTIIVHLSPLKGGLDGGDGRQQLPLQAKAITKRFQQRTQEPVSAVWARH